MPPHLKRVDRHLARSASYGVGLEGFRDQGGQWEKEGGVKGSGRTCMVTARAVRGGRCPWASRGAASAVATRAAASSGRVATWTM